MLSDGAPGSPPRAARPRSEVLMTRRLCLSLSILIPLVGCATLEHGMVLERLDATDARVRLGKADGITPGTRIGFYEQQCRDHLTALGEEEQCEDVKVGGGRVLQVLDDSTSIVRADPGSRLYWTQLVRPDVAPTH